jgi:hypothetical protein
VWTQVHLFLLERPLFTLWKVRNLNCGKTRQIMARKSRNISESCYSCGIGTHLKCLIPEYHKHTYYVLFTPSGKVMGRSRVLAKGGIQSPKTRCLRRIEIGVQLEIFLRSGWKDRLECWIEDEKTDWNVKKMRKGPAEILSISEKELIVKSFKVHI